MDAVAHGARVFGFVDWSSSRDTEPRCPITRRKGAEGAESNWHNRPSREVHRSVNPMPNVSRHHQRHPQRDSNPCRHLERVVS
jgi:hypothetical protein